MKCIQCGTDNTFSERTRWQGRCKECKHRFVFEPKTDRVQNNGVQNYIGINYISLTDVFFAKVLNDLSANNTLYFTPKQLFYFLEKRLQKKAIHMQIRNLFVCGWLLMILGAYLSLEWIFGIGLILLPLSLIIWVNSWSKRPRKLLISQNVVGLWINLWNQVNFSEKLLSLPRNRSTSRIQPTSPSGDIIAYSFDRLVVCDSVEIAQMLIANNFHFENNCAVLSISGYPEQVFSTVMQMLRRNPNLRVFAFHNCSPSGIELLHQLRTNPTWFAESNAVIIDVGLLPRQIMAARKNITIQNSKQSAQNLAPQIRQTLSEAELQWLDAGNWVDLESFTPKALIQILQRSIARSQTINETDSSLLRIEDEDGRYGSIYMVDGMGGFG